MDLDETIHCWKTNYGFADKTPMQAAEWWRHAAGGSDIAAPVGAILALAAAIEQIERLRAELAECKRVIDVARHSVAREIAQMRDAYAGYITGGRLREIETAEKLLTEMHAALAAKEEG